MKIIKKYLTKGQYIPHHNKKFSLWLHHTVSSSWQSSWNWWNQTKQRVGTAYIIARNGDIIECFDPMAFAYHLGIKGDDNFHEKHGIGIEMVSMGRLTKKGDYFYDSYNQIVPEVEVCKLKNKFRGTRYFQKLTFEQIESLCHLIQKIRNDHPDITLPDDFKDIFRYDESVFNERKSGIYAHSAVRKDKDDLFPQKNLISSLNNFFTHPIVNHKNPKEKHNRT